MAQSLDDDDDVDGGFGADATLGGGGGYMWTGGLDDITYEEL
jgi:hypothetical protein